jgi:hypothetical protein
VARIHFPPDAIASFFLAASTGKKRLPHKKGQLMAGPPPKKRFA